MVRGTGNPADQDPIERMIEEGLLEPPTSTFDDLPPPCAVPGDAYAGTRALEAIRGDGA
jgi:hypothetical protein